MNDLQRLQHAVLDYMDSLMNEGYRRRELGMGGDEIDLGQSLARRDLMDVLESQGLQILADDDGWVFPSLRDISENPTEPVPAVDDPDTIIFRRDGEG